MNTEFIVKASIIIICVTGGLFLYSKHLKKKALLKERYEEALKGDDKALALKLGREYYSYLRNSGKLTIYDEQAITNDLSTMK